MSPQQTELKNMSKENNLNVATAIEEEDEPDDWDKRIFSTGCAAENTKMNDCYFEKKDWRLCRKELESFKRCWKQQENDKRTEMKDT